MTEKRHIDHDTIQRRVVVLARRIVEGISLPRLVKIYGVPRGGIPVAYLLAGRLEGLRSSTTVVITDRPENAHIIVDDLIDSGRTMERYDRYGVPFYALFNKQGEDSDAGWLVFPWEGSVENSAEDFTVRLLQFIGEDPNRGGLVETPARVAKAWQGYTAGYNVDPASVLKCFEDGGERYDEMVLVRDLPFYTHCEHHLAPFFGTADIAYIPNGRIVGLSKLDRVLDIFARRLQVQERLTGQIVDALMEHLQPKGAAVRITARHLCMESRGVRKQGHETVTNALRGVFFNDEKTRAEFFASLR